MRTIQTRPPGPELREFVQVYAQREMECGSAGFSQPDSAYLEQGFSFHIDGKTILDSADGRSSLAPKVWAFGSTTPPCGGTQFAGHVLAFAIFLKPLALWQLFRIPPRLLANRDYAAEDLVGKSILDLLSIVEESKTFQQRISAAEAYLLPFAAQARGRTLVLKTAQHMLDRRGAPRVEEIANHARMSVRQYERRFVEEVGMTPKLFARVTRFQHALDAKRLSPLRSWLSVAHEFGYFDQMHMIRDFQSLGGDAPGNVLDQSGDIQPWSLAPHQELEMRPPEGRRDRRRSGQTKSHPID